VIVGYTFFTHVTVLIRARGMQALVCSR